MGKKNQSVGIVGLGHVGIETIKALGGMNEISNFYLFTGDTREKGELWKDIITHTYRKSVDIADYKYLHNYMEDLDVIIITSDKSDYRNKVALGLKREDVINANIPLAHYLSDQFSKRKHEEFNGTIIPVTNQVDIFTHLLWDQSGIMPERFAGMNHLLQITWEETIKDVYRGLNAKENFLDHIDTAVLGPHSEYAVPIFFDLGGMPRAHSPYVKNDDNYKKLIESAKGWSDKQFKLGMKYGLGTEIEAANATKKVLEAIFDEESVVTTSVLLKPSEMGFDSDKPGIFSGWRVKFKDGISIPQFDFKIEEQKDLDALAIAGQWQEGILNELEEKKEIKEYPERTISLEDYSPKKEVPSIIRLYKPFPIEFSVVAAADGKHFRWDSLNKIAKPEVREFERKPHCFSVEYIEGEVKYLTGHEEGLSIVDPESLDEIVFHKEAVGSVRDVKIHPIDGKPHLWGGDRESVFIFNLENQKKPIIELSGFYDSLNEFIIEDFNGVPVVYVAAYGIHQFMLNNPEKPLEMFGKNRFTDLAIKGDKLYGSSENLIEVFDMSVSRGYSESLTRLPLGICDLRLYEISGIDKIFASTDEPVIYQISEEGKLEATFRKERGNPYGIVKMQILPVEGRNYLLSADESKRGEKRPTGITIHNVAFSPDEPLRFLSTCQTHKVRGFGALI